VVNNDSDLAGLFEQMNGIVATLHAQAQQAA
jgi:hypothetical protein